MIKIWLIDISIKCRLTPLVSSVLSGGRSILPGSQLSVVLWRVSLPSPEGSPGDVAGGAAEQSLLHNGRTASMTWSSIWMFYGDVSVKWCLARVSANLLLSAAVGHLYFLAICVVINSSFSSLCAEAQTQARLGVPAHSPVPEEPGWGRRLLQPAEGSQTTSAGKVPQSR